MSVALDTMVLIWGLRKGNPQKGTLSDHDAEMQRRSRILLRDLDEKKETVIVPAVTVAELLCPLDPRGHGEFIAVLTQRFFCPPFDIRAASLAAELWQYNRGLPSSEQISEALANWCATMSKLGRLRPPKMAACHPSRRTNRRAAIKV